MLTVAVTLELTLLTFCPPGPPEREKVNETVFSSDWRNSSRFMPGVCTSGQERSISRFSLAFVLAKYYIYIIKRNTCIVCFCPVWR